MTKTRVLSFGLSLDGYGAGPNQSLTNPLGENFTDVMDWFFPTAVFTRCAAAPAAKPERTINSRKKAWPTSARGFSGEICLAPFVVLGRTISGKDGGGKSRPITFRCLC